MQPPTGRMCSAALTDVIKTVRPSVQRGLEPSVDAGFTAQQYASAITAIVTGPAHAVLASELKKLLGGGNAGKEVLQALVRENLVAYRPYSTWATDIDMDAFGPQQEEVVTAPTLAHLFCMRQLNLPDAPPADTVRNISRDWQRPCSTYPCPRGQVGTLQMQGLYVMHVTLQCAWQLNTW